MVFSAARRMVGDSCLAEEVAQGVFTTLAQKASAIASPQVVSGWLYNTTRHLAMHAVRTEQRRRVREQAAAAMQITDSDAERITEHLEPAKAELEAGERDLLVLRYLENRSLRQVGDELGISEDAARMRVNRALERLRTMLGREGIGVTSVLLATTLSSSTAPAVPAGLGAAITATALAGIAAATTHTAITTMNWINAKAVAAIVGAAVLTGTGTYLVQQRQIGRLHHQRQGLLAQYEKLTADREASLAATRVRDNELERLRNEVRELARLRN